MICIICLIVDFIVLLALYKCLIRYTDTRQLVINIEYPFITEKSQGLKTRKFEREMKGLMMVGIVLFMTIQLKPSSAQEDCWQKIITCVENSASPEEFQQQCCESLLQEINNERECFCSFKPVLLQNATLDGFVSRLLSLCGLTTSFHAICPGIY